MSALMTRRLVQMAIAMHAVSIKELLDHSGYAKRSALSIVVLDPSTGEPLFSGNFGQLERDQWTADYEAIALAKAKLAFKHKKNTGEVVGQPQLLEPGDTKHRGGVFFNGIPVGVSGVQSYIDEAVAMWVATTCQMLCQYDFEEKVKPAKGETVTPVD